MAIKVLVVDRSRNTESIVKDTLVPLGCQIITATSTALGVFLARKNFPALIIHGVEAVDEIDLPFEISSDPDLAHIPVVVIADKEARGSNGAAKLLTRPISAERLFDELRPYLFENVDERDEETSE